MTSTDQFRPDRPGASERQPEQVTAPPTHAGIVRALNACFARAPVLPDDLRHLLDRLR